MGKNKKLHVVFPRVETFHFHKAYDGGAKLIHYLSQELIKQGVDVTIVTTPFEKKDYKTRKYQGVKYVFLSPYYGKPRLTKLNIPYKMMFSYNLMRYLKKTDFSIFHSAESFAYFYLHKKERNPVIFQCWGLKPWCGPESLSQKGIKKLYVKLFLQKPWGYCLRKSDLIASDGEYQIPKIEELAGGKKKRFFLPDSVNFREIQKMKKHYTNRRKELGIKKEDLLILSVCQIVPDKGIEDIINGFVLLKKEIKNAKLLMVGKGELEKMMYNLIKKNKLEEDVLHKKNVSEKVLYDYYFTSNIFVSAVTSKEFMVSILEAMSCGLPIISSAQPFLVKEGINGYVVGMKNPKGIAIGILKIYKKKQMKKMGEESKKHAKRYDHENIAKFVIKEYEKLIKKEK